MGGVAVMTTLSLGLSAYLIALCFLDKDKVLTRSEFNLLNFLDYMQYFSKSIVLICVILYILILQLKTL